jgi:hypothetical protein
VWASLSPLGARSWQVGHQVGGTAIRQGCWVDGHDYQSLRLLGTIWSALCLQSPPPLDATVAERAFEPYPFSRIFRAIPGGDSGEQGRLPDISNLILGSPPSVRRSQSHHKGDVLLQKSPAEVYVIPVESRSPSQAPWRVWVQTLLHRQIVCEHERGVGARQRLGEVDDRYPTPATHCSPSHLLGARGSTPRWTSDLRT